MTSRVKDGALALFGQAEGRGKCLRQFQLSRSSFIFKYYLLNVATFTNPIETGGGVRLSPLKN